MGTGEKTLLLNYLILIWSFGGRYGFWIHKNIYMKFGCVLKFRRVVGGRFWPYRNRHGVYRVGRSGWRLVIKIQNIFITLPIIVAGGTAFRRSLMMWARLHIILSIFKQWQWDIFRTSSELDQAFMFDDVQNLAISREVKSDEVLQVLNTFAHDKSLGSDGWLVKFSFYSSSCWGKTSPRWWSTWNISQGAEKA